MSEYLFSWPDMKRWEPPTYLRRAFWEQVQRCAHGTLVQPCAHCCWPWTGATNEPQGYGVLRQPLPDGYAAHRMAWELFYQCRLPSDIWSCHHCDNKPCCNPRHVFPGTREDNRADMLRKRRHKHLFTDAQVLEMRRLFHEEGWSWAALSAHFGMPAAKLRPATLGRVYTYLPFPSQPRTIRRDKQPRACKHPELAGLSPSDYMRAWRRKQRERTAGAPRPRKRKHPELVGLSHREYMRLWARKRYGHEPRTT